MRARGACAVGSKDPARPGPPPLPPYRGDSHDEMMTIVNRTQEPVLVGVDGSGSALDAVRWAAREAARRHARLRLINAFEWVPMGDLGDPRLGMNYGITSREVLQDNARVFVDDAAAAAAQVAPGVEVTGDVLTGYPITELVAQSAHAQLVVIGDRGLGGFTGLLVGSVAVALAAHAACPVVAVRGAVAGGPPPLDGPVVVGVDGSPTSEAALAFAFEAAAMRRAPLVAVHTWQDFVVDVVMSPLLDWDAVEVEERQILAERLAGWGEKYPDVQVQRVVTKDRPAHALVEQSAGAQLVVVGSRGRGALPGLVLGSVSHALLHHAKCPVAVVRPDAADDPR